MAEVSKSLSPTLYADLLAAGSLSGALDDALARVPLTLRAEADTIPTGFLVYSSVRSGSRHSQVMVAEKTRAFHVDCWESGVQYGGGWHGSLDEVARAIEAFVSQRLSTGALQAAFTWLDISETAKLHEQGAAPFVDQAWQGLAQWLAKDRPMTPLLPLVEAAAKRAELRQLLPFTSMVSLHFSRYTGYPFSDDCPFAEPTQGDRFRVYRSGPDGQRELVGEGAAEEAVDLLVRYLPPGCGPAVNGVPPAEVHPDGA